VWKKDKILKWKNKKKLRQEKCVGDKKRSGSELTRPKAVVGEKSSKKRRGDGCALERSLRPASGETSDTGGMGPGEKKKETSIGQLRRGVSLPLPCGKKEKTVTANKQNNRQG